MRYNTVTGKIAHQQKQVQFIERLNKMESNELRKLLTKKEVKEIVRIKSDTSFDDLRFDEELAFPKPIKIGLRRLGWFEDEVIAWQKKSAEMRQ